MGVGDTHHKLVTHTTSRVGRPRSLSEAAAVHGSDEFLPVGTQVWQRKVFEIVEPLGEGGMGKIYRAYDPSMDRYVALKVLKPNVPQAERERFHREAVISANFSHPNLVRVLEVGEEGESKWYAMEYLRGRDIGAVISTRKALSFRVLCDVFTQTMEALEYIHTRCIAHCDIKPENIFVTRDAYDRRLVIVKLIDFGISKKFDGPLELSEYISGDPRYMAPEQTFLNQPFDHRVDIYALGMTFYECLCQRHPWEEYLGCTPEELLELQRNYAPSPPSEHLPHNTPVKLASAFDEFFFHCVAKDPNERFQSANAMRVATEKMLALLNEEQQRAVTIAPPQPEKLIEKLKPG